MRAGEAAEAPKVKPKTRLRVLEVGGTKHTLEWPLISEAELRAVCDMSNAKFGEWARAEQGQGGPGGTWAAADGSWGESATAGAAGRGATRGAGAAPTP